MILGQETVEAKRIPLKDKDGKAIGFAVKFDVKHVVYEDGTTKFSLSHSFFRLDGPSGQFLVPEGEGKFKLADGTIYQSDDQNKPETEKPKVEPKPEPPKPPAHPAVTQHQHPPHPTKPGMRR